MFLSLTQGHQHGISLPSASSADTGLNSDQLLAKALFPAWVWVYTVGVTFCVKIKHVSKCICPVWLHEWEDWIHALSKPLVMGGGVGLVFSLFSSWFICLNLPSAPATPFVLLSWSHPITLSPVDSQNFGLFYFLFYSENTPEGRRMTKLDQILLNGNNITMVWNVQLYSLNWDF